MPFAFIMQKKLHAMLYNSEVPPDRPDQGEMSTEGFDIFK
jgi:hypothetical protein